MRTRQFGPAAGCLGIQRGFQIIAQHRTQSGFIAFGDTDIGQNGPISAGITACHQFRQRAYFGFEPLRGPVGIFHRLAGILLALAQGLQILARGFRFGLAGLVGFFGLFQSLAGLQKFVIQPCQGRNLLLFLRLAGKVSPDALFAGLFVGQSPLGCGIAGGQIRHFGTQILQGGLGLHLGGFALAQDIGRITRQTFRRRRLAEQRRVLGIQQAQSRVGIGAHAVLAFQIAPQFRLAPFKFDGALLGAPLLAVQSLAGQSQTLQARGRRHFRIAQRGHACRQNGLILGGCGLHQRMGLHRRQRTGMGALGLVQGLGRSLPGPKQQQRFYFADIGGDIAIARRLPRLPFQTVDLFVDLVEHIVDAPDIFLGRLQPQFGLVAARMQTRNACRIFQNPASGLRLCRNDFADLPLPHHRMRACTGGGIGKQQLHIAGTDLARIDPVMRSRLALDPAADLDLVEIVEGRGRGAGTIVEMQRHFRHVAAWTVAGSGENYIIHARGTQGFIGAFAHHPAQGLDQIGFAATIGTDNAGQTGFDQKFGRFDKGFEADELEARQFHRDPLTSGEAQLTRSQQRNNRLIEFLNRHSPAIHLAVDKESRCCVDLEILAATRTHRNHRVINRLVFQAGFKTFLCETGLTHQSLQGFGGFVGIGPGFLGAEQQIGDRVEPLVAVAARQHETGDGQRIKREFTQYEADLAGFDVFGLQLGQDIGMECRTMRAGQRGIFVNRDLGIVFSHHDIAQRSGNGKGLGAEFGFRFGFGSQHKGRKADQAIGQSGF